jgi:catechol 2,3-dioxygenase-like lactoylglutathione lyase family enzyme
MTLRFARHTNNLEKTEDFYVNILGFERMGDFQNHNNYNGVFIGKPDLDWHFEFTTSNDKTNHHFDEDDVVVLYPATILEYNNLLDSISKSNISIIAAKNPYWNENGKMILDPDGFRIVISPLKAKAC